MNPHHTASPSPNFAQPGRSVWLALVVALLLPALGRGQTAIWTNGSGSGLWSDAANWDSGVVPGSGPYDQVWLSDASLPSDQVINLAGDRSLYALQFRSQTHNYTLNGSTLTLTGDGIVTQFNFGSPASLTINSNLAVATNTAIKKYIVGAGSAITVNGGIDLGANTLSLTGSTFSVGSSQTTLNGIISGTGSLSINPSSLGAGGGNFTLAGANTYSGGTLFNGIGILRVTHASALGSGALNSTNAGNTLHTLEIAADGGLAFGNNVSVEGLLTLTSDRLTSGAGQTHTFGTLLLASYSSNVIQVRPGGNVTSGTAGVTFGATTISPSTTVDVGANAMLTLGALSDGPGGSITKIGSGTLYLSSTATDWTRIGDALVINGGKVQLGADSALGADSHTPVSYNTIVTVNATAPGTTATLDLNGHYEGISKLNFGGAGATSTSTNVVSMGSGTLALAGDVTYAATNNPLGATLSGNLLLGTGISPAIHTFSIADSSNAATDLTVSAVVSGTDGLTKTGAGTLALTGANTYSGGTTVNGGILSADTLANGGSASSIGSSNNSASNLVLAGGTLRYVGSGSTSDRLLTLGQGSGGGFSSFGFGVTDYGNTLDSSGSGALVLTNTGPIAISGLNASNTLTLAGTNTANNTLAAKLQDNGTAKVGLVKNDPGTWVVTGANTFTGDTSINGGTLVVGSLANGGVASSIGASTNDDYNLHLAGTLKYIGTGSSTDRLFNWDAGAALDASGSGTLTFSNPGLLSFNGTFVAGVPVTKTFTLAGTNTGNNTLAGTLPGISGQLSFALLKSGAGTWVLTGNNAYTGGTTISGGKLQIGNGGTTGSVAGNITDNASLVFNRSNDLAYAGVISGSGDVSKYGAGTLVLTGANTYLGNTFIHEGTLQIGDGGTTGSIHGDVVVNNAILAFRRFDPVTYAGVISGIGNVVLAGGGTVTFSSGSSYTGSTDVNTGTLRVNGSIASSAMTTVHSGATLGGSGTVGALTLNSGSFLAPGNSPGTLTAGNTVWNGGATYLWQINSALGTAGTNWDLLNVNGSLSIAASSANPFHVSLYSLTGAGAAGMLADFNPAQSASFLIASTTAGITGFSADAFTVDTANFLNGATGTWSVAVDGNNLDLNYTATAVPEPSTYAILAGLAALGLAVRHRRPRSAAIR